MHPTIRNFKKNDEAFVNRSWKSSYLHDGFESWASRSDFWREMNRRCGILIGPDTVLVAHNPFDEEHVLGWVCSSGGVLHYVWVRQEYRGAGLARGLVAAALVGHPEPPVECSHWTKVCEVVQTRHRLEYWPSKRRPDAQRRDEGRELRDEQPDAGCDPGLLGNPG